ncbi:methyltransferase family protein [Paracoccus angustae]|uniref:Methyltransferase family protein n=1 Tax=Paracoccus angustae TaxID=1671480 RepID=A0ABV7U5Z2_9RHOB
MASGFGGSALAILAAYLLLFLWGTAETGRANGRTAWLMARSRGRDRRAAFAFRLAFACSFVGPLVWSLSPALRRLDPFWSGGDGAWVGMAGVFAAALGAMIAFAAQMSMGASWRVGVKGSEVGGLVTGGLFRISRNPTFIGQCLLLTGVALALPALPTLIGPPLFLAAARAQVPSEEAVLRRAHGAAYDDWARQVPRWIGPCRRSGSLRRGG